ncbi:MAG: ABC transporter permease [Dehalococcoidia bacterium]
MQRYIAQRLLLLIPTLAILMTAVFGLVRLVPGDPVAILLSEQAFSTKWDHDQLQKQLGLDRTLPSQYGHWLGRLIHGDLGVSLYSRDPIGPAIVKRFKVTAEIAALAMLFSLLISAPVGIVAAVRANTIADYLCRGASIVGLSVPSFFMGTAILVYGSIWLNWIPPIRFIPFTDNPLANLAQFALPAIILGIHLAAVQMRMTRSALLEVLRQDYVRTARAKGLGFGPVILRHALRNSLLPVITITGLQFGALLGGTVIIETIFNLPGLGIWMADAVRQRDYPVIQGVNLIFAVLVIGLNLIVDLSYGFVDPRIRYQ